MTEQLTQDQLAALQLVMSQVSFEEVDAALCKQDLFHFIRGAWPILEPSRPFVSGWHLEAMAEHLIAVSNRQCKRLAMMVPPGSMKSLMTRVFWPSWEWTMKPELRYIGASYASHLAERDNRRTRSVVLSDWYQNRFRVKLSKDQSQKTNFANDDTGFMIATSVDGMATGERGDRFIIDDPHNVLRAESKADRERALIWFNEAVPSRLNDQDNDPIIVIMQRVHEEDICGEILRRDLGYDTLTIPMEYEGRKEMSTLFGLNLPDPREKEDELMCPQRFSRESVDRLKRQMGPYASAGQLQQTPVPRAGGMFQVERLHQLDELPEEEALVKIRGWDLAGSEGEGAYTVGVLIGWYPKRQRWIIEDVKRDRLSSAKVRKLMKATAEADGEEIRIVYPQDPGQAGKDQAFNLAGLLKGFAVTKESQTGSKEVRADAFASQIEMGYVEVLNRPWLKDYINELRFFPKGKYADQVDASASAFNKAAKIVRAAEKEEDDLNIDGERTDNMGIGAG